MQLEPNFESMMRSDKPVTRGSMEKPILRYDLVQRMYQGLSTDAKTTSDTWIRQINKALMSADWSQESPEIELPVAIRAKSDPWRYVCLAFRNDEWSLELLSSTSNQHGSQSRVRVTPIR